MRVIREELIKLSDNKYSEFNSKLCPDTKRKIMGITVPTLRNYAKDLVKEYEIKELLGMIKDEYFEEVQLQGFLIGYAKIPLAEKMKYIEEFVPKIDSWAITDTFVPTLKINEKELEDGWQFISPYLSSDKEFEIRFAVIMMLDYYIIPEYIDKVIEELDKIKNEGYYVKMGVAWTLSVIGVKFYDKFIKYFKKSNLDKFTHNKTIQKMCESYRITDEIKTILRGMKIK